MSQGANWEIKNKETKFVCFPFHVIRCKYCESSAEFTSKKFIALVVTESNTHVHTALFHCRCDWLGWRLLVYRIVSH